MLSSAACWCGVRSSSLAKCRMKNLSDPGGRSSGGRKAVTAVLSNSSARSKITPTTVPSSNVPKNIAIAAVFVFCKFMLNLFWCGGRAENDEFQQLFYGHRRAVLGQQGHGRAGAGGRQIVLLVQGGVRGLQRRPYQHDGQQCGQRRYQAFSQPDEVCRKPVRAPRADDMRQARGEKRRYGVGRLFPQRRARLLQALQFPAATHTLGQVL